MTNTEIAGIGHNNPPEPTRFETISAQIEALYDEAKLWLDGEPVSNQGQADDLSSLLNMIRAAHKEADEARKAECKPFDEGKSEVQAKYAPLIADTKSVKGKTTLAMDACKKALAPWLAKLDEEKRQAAEKARLEAEAKQREAQEALQAAQEADLAEREAAEAKVRDAKKAEQAASRAERDTAKSGGAVGRAVSLRTRHNVTLTDGVAAARHYWTTNRRAEIESLLVTFAKQDVCGGARDIPGFEVKEEKVAV